MYSHSTRPDRRSPRLSTTATANARPEDELRVLVRELLVVRDEDGRILKLAERLEQRGVFQSLELEVLETRRIGNAPIPEFGSKPRPDILVEDDLAVQAAIAFRTSAS